MKIVVLLYHDCLNILEELAFYILFNYMNKMLKYFLLSYDVCHLQFTSFCYAFRERSISFTLPVCPLYSYVCYHLWVSSSSPTHIYSENSSNLCRHKNIQHQSTKVKVSVTDQGPFMNYHTLYLWYLGSRLRMVIVDSPSCKVLCRALMWPMSKGSKGTGTDRSLWSGGGVT